MSSVENFPSMVSVKKSKWKVYICSVRYRTVFIKFRHWKSAFICKRKIYFAKSQSLNLRLAFTWGSIVNLGLGSSFTMIPSVEVYLKLNYWDLQSTFCAFWYTVCFWIIKPTHINTVKFSLWGPLEINITKTCLYNFDPFKPHFYIVKLWFTGVYIIFLISAENIDCGYSLEPHRRGGSNEYPESMFSAEIWKISEFFFIWIFSVLGGKIFSIFE